MPIPTKADFRKTLRARRAAIDVAHQTFASENTNKIFKAEAIFNEAQHIAAYMAHLDELDVQPIIESIWEANKKCYLPVLSQTQNQALHFFLHDAGEPLFPNQFHILEPPNIGQEFPAENLDVVLLPLIGFDKYGHRLGTGGGFYDNTFAFLSDKNRKKKPLLIGVGYAIQGVSALPFDEWDITLDGILTEEKLLMF